MKGGARQSLNKNDNQRRKNFSEQNQKDGKIDLKRFSENDEKEKKQNVFKVLFRKNKAFDLHSDADERPTVDAEAKKISERFNLAHNLLWIVLIVFVVIFFAFFSDSITTGSMQHMFRNMFGHGDVTGSVSEYYFSVNENAVFDGFSGVPVMAGSDRVVIFAPDGSHQYSDESKYSVPELKTSDKYILIYDKNGGMYGIYDAFGIRHSESGNRIYGGALADDGTYAIARKGNEYNSEISIYTSNFELLNLIKKNNRVASVDIKADGSELMLLTYSVAPSGSVESELMLLETRSDSPRKLFTLNEGMPLECKYLENGQIALLFDDMLSILSSDGEEISSITVDVDEMYMYELFDNGALAFFERVHEDSDKFLFKFIKLDENGVKRAECAVSSRALDLNMYGDYAYIITEHEAVKFDTLNAEKVGSYQSDKKIYSLFTSSEKEYICFVDSIKEIKFE